LVAPNGWVFNKGRKDQRDFPLPNWHRIVVKTRTLEGGTGHGCPDGKT